MQPQEFNAFVAAVISARQAQLMTPKRAQELIENASAPFLAKSQRAATREAIVTGRRMSLVEASKLDYEGKEFYLCLTADAGVAEWDPDDPHSPLCINGEWLQGDKLEVIIPSE